LKIAVSRTAGWEAAVGSGPRPATPPYRDAPRTCGAGDHGLPGPVVDKGGGRTLKQP
jgi:hypothetical protein